MLKVVQITYVAWIIVVSVLSASLVSAGGGVDKSGLKPQVLKLPDGPGSIEGLGESFEAQLNSGTATYSVPLSLPPGRAGFAPPLALVYNGGNGNGPLGGGWRFSSNYIQRQTDKGLPVYDDTKDVFINSDGEELVNIGDGYYRCENETTFDRYERDGVVWKVTHRNGSKSVFGSDEKSRIQDGTNIFKWYISRQEDANGNEILYRYNEDSSFTGGAAPSDGQVYLTSIVYNQGFSPEQVMKVELKYETRAAHDSVFSYLSRFPVQTTQRCIEIIMYESSHRVRSYKLKYDSEAILSRLASIEIYGKDEAQGPLESIISFEYTDFELNSVVTPMNTGLNPSVGLGLPNVDLVDMNGDALPDLLHTGDVHEVYFNEDGQKWEEPYDIPGGFTEIKLDHPNTMLMDMNGDGYSDLFSQDISIDGYRYFKGGQSNNGWKLIPTEMANSPSFTFGDITKPVDLDNDGRTDVIRKGEFSSEIACVFNQKGESWSGFFSADAPSTRAVFNFGSEDGSGLRLADMNGDGLQDFVVLNGEGYIWYYPGHGVTNDSVTPWKYQGWDNTPRGAWEQGDSSAEGYRMVDAPDSFDASDFSEVSNFRKIRMLDINGDGMSDLVYVANNRLLAWLNMGGHAFSPDPFIVPAESYQIPDQTSETFVRTVDMNANGTVDIVWNRQMRFSEIGYDCSWVYLDLTKGVRSNLLKKIDNGIGQVTTISYKSSTEYLVEDRAEGRDWNFKVPFPVNVVSRIEVFDGRNSIYVREMTYHDGYYDGEEKEFRGFASAEQKEIGDNTAPDLIMAYAFDTGAAQESLKGKPLMLEAKNPQEQTFYREEYSWKTRILADGVNGDERKVTFPYQEAKTRDIIEKGNGTPVQLKWEYEFDNYGNTTRHMEHGRLDSGWDDERLTVTSYTASYPSGLANWILDKVVEQTTSDENGNKAALKRNYYDGGLVLGVVSKGNLTRMEDWVSGDEFVVSTRNDFDSYGNIVAIYDALYGTKPGHYRELVYDDTYHTFPVEERIHTGALTLIMKAAYDYGWGKMISSTEYNGHTTNYKYDNFGRLSSITKPPDTGHTVEYDYVLAHDLGDGKFINWVETRQRETDGGGTVDSRKFYDGMGRTIMTRSEGENPGQIVVSDTVVFNARKQPSKKYLPYFEENSSLDFVEPTYNTGFTEHFYDALSREVRVNQPVGSDGIVFARTAYGALNKTVYDEEQTDTSSIHYGNGKRYVEDGLQDKDGKGRLREVYEIVKLSDLGEPLTEPVEWRTTYTYNLLDNLTGYTDSQGNQKIMEFDGLGRKTFMNDPDRGYMRYEFDDAGNLVKTTDAKDQIIKYDYDGVNRLLAEYYGENKSEPDVAYHYDVPYGPVSLGDIWQSGQAGQIADAILKNLENVPEEYDLNNDNKVDVADVVQAARNPVEATPVTAQNTLGYLAWVKDQSGEEHNSFDARGRVSWVIKRIVNTGPDTLRNFHTSMEYDSMDRITRQIYPDQTYVDYVYNNRGLLESVPDVIDRYDYNPAGQNAMLELACGTVTAYDYDHRLRLDKLKTTRSSDGLMLQDLNYIYDKISNITQIKDGRSNGDLDTIGGEIGIGSAEARKFNATQSFSYDALYRLTQATNTTVYGTINYRYSRIANMVSKNASLVNPDPLMDLGAMTSGGTAGTHNRIGRNPGDPPGPHAITATAKGPNAPMTFSYDDSGNMLTNRGMNLSWDFKDRLAGLSNGTKTASYKYDYTGTRKKKNVTDSSNGSTSEVFYVDKLSEVRDSKLMKYVYAGNSRVARTGMISKGTSALTPETFYLHDHLGSTNLAVSNNATVTEQLANYPYGYPRNEKRNSLTTLADYKFTGKERDVESQLQYFEARYYEPVVGRFVSVDPLYVEVDRLNEEKFQKFLDSPQEINIYVYAGNNPVNLVDPYGTSNEEKNFESTEYWTQKWVETGNPLYAIPGTLASFYETVASQGEEATEFWAERYVASDNKMDAVMGSFSALATRDTLWKTMSVLTAAKLVSGWAAKTGPSITIGAITRSIGKGFKKIGSGIRRVWRRTLRQNKVRRLNNKWRRPLKEIGKTIDDSGQFQKQINAIKKAVSSPKLNKWYTYGK